MNAMRKLTVRSMATLTLWITIVCFLTLTFQLVITWINRQNRGYEVFNSSLSYMTRNTSVSEQPTNKFINSLARNKIEEIKRELNDLTLTSDAMLPVNRIGEYIFLDSNLCKSVITVDIIIIVHTAPAHIERRQRIRDSFANSSLFYSIQIRVAFLLGKTQNAALMRMLWLEHTTHNDTVMGDFIDDYHNLTIKGAMGYRWLSDHCTNSEFVLKIDDDVLINMFKLIHSFLPQMKRKKRSIFCNFWYRGRMPIHRRGKWKVDSHIFPTRTTNPYDYCSGFVVIMTSDLIVEMYQAAKITPAFWVDDVYLYGMLPFVVGNVTYHNYPLGKYMKLNYRYAINCTLTQGVRCPMFATQISDHEYWSYWKIITDMYITNLNIATKVVN